MKYKNRNQKHHIRTSKKGTPEYQKEEQYILPSEIQRKKNIELYKERKLKKLNKRR